MIKAILICVGIFAIGVALHQRYRSWKSDVSDWQDWEELTAEDDEK